MLFTVSRSDCFALVTHSKSGKEWQTDCLAQKPCTHLLAALWQRHSIQQICHCELVHWSGWTACRLYYQTHLNVVVNNSPSKAAGENTFYGLVFRQRWEAIFFYQLLIEQDRRFGHQLLVMTLKINIKQSTPNAVLPVPLKAIQEGPDCVAKHVNSIVPDSWGKNKPKLSTALIFPLQITPYQQCLQH